MKMNAVHQGYLRISMTAPETELFHQVLEFYYQACFNIWLPRSGSLDGLRAESQVHALEQKEMKFNLWQGGAEALLSLFEKEPALPKDEEDGKTLVADLRTEIKRNIEQLTTCTNI